MRWPLAEALLALEAQLQRHDLEQHRFEQLLYVIGGGRRRPRVPRSLESRTRPGPVGQGW